MEKALISKIQRYSTQDGPGIRSTVFMLGCNLKCKWCANPELISGKEEVLFHKNKCQLCGLCVEMANNNSIVKGDSHVIIDRSKCTNIKDLVDLCPYDAYEQIGTLVSSEKLYEQLMRDYDFYKESNGGVTFSGGEAALQSNFVIEVSKQLKQNNVHVALDTAGHIGWKSLSELVKHVDLVLFDIKAYDSSKHAKGTDVGNELVLENIEKLAKLNIPLHIRMLVIPNYNDDSLDVINRINFIYNLGSAVKQLDILEYHVLGVGKYEQLGKEYTFNKNAQPNHKLIKTYVDYARSLGLKVTVGA